MISKIYGSFVGVVFVEDFEPFEFLGVEDEVEGGEEDGTKVIVFLESV